MTKLKILFLFILFSLSTVIFAQASVPFWYILEQGKYFFREGRYGEALITFEDARRARLAQFTRMEEDFIRLLSNSNVRLLGDSLEYIEQYASINYETAAISALTELYYRIPKDSLKGSAKKALEEMNRLKSYPEAEYWLGETYRAEGELSMAFRHYETAIKDRDLLENPGFETEILYKITDIHRMRQQYQEMEKRVNEIIEGSDSSGTPRDSLWFRENAVSATQMRSAMSRILENEGVGRFLTLYRHNNPVTEKAHRLMGFFCYSGARYPLAAEHLMFAFLIQNTVLLNEVIRRQYDYTFTSLEDLVNKIQGRPELSEYIEETEYYRTIYYLASALYANGKTRPARELWAFLASSNNAGQWGNRARRSPNPVLDRAIEMP